MERNGIEKGVCANGGGGRRCLLAGGKGSVTSLLWGTRGIFSSLTYGDLRHCSQSPPNMFSFFLMSSSSFKNIFRNSSHKDGAPREMLHSPTRVSSLGVSFMAPTYQSV